MHEGDRELILQDIDAMLRAQDVTSFISIAINSRYACQRRLAQR
jgi:hypothetical protein